jgi:hypothetical protein
MRRLNAWKEARLKRNAIDAQCSREFNELRERHTPFWRSLLRINFAEKAVKAIAIDSDFHDLRGYHRSQRVIPQEPFRRPE